MLCNVFFLQGVELHEAASYGQTKFDRIFQLLESVDVDTADVVSCRTALAKGLHGRKDKIVY